MSTYSVLSIVLHIQCSKMSKMVIKHKEFTLVGEQICGQCLIGIRKEDLTDGGQVSKRTQKSITQCIT